MADATRTVYHPSLDAAYDVPEGEVEGWKAAGWRMSPASAEQAEAVADTVNAAPAKK